MIDWHYPRPELAQAHLAQLFDQGLSRLAFFGRRRIGKTEYLRRDLIPAAQAKGVVDTFYCSFWENKDHPQLALIRALQDALPEKQAKAKAKAGLNLGVLDFSAEVERADRPKPALPNELTLAAAGKNARIVTLDIPGKPWTTEQLAQQLEAWKLDGRDVALLIGGPEGLAPECKALAEQSWSLSPLTLPHPLVRVVVAESLYRAWSITTNHPYHRE